MVKQDTIHDENGVNCVYCGKNFVLFATDKYIKAVSQHNINLEATLKTTSTPLYILKSDQPRVFVIVCKSELLIVRVEKKCKRIEQVCTIRYDNDSRTPTCAFSAQTWFVVAFDNVLHYYFFKSDN